MAIVKMQKMQVVIMKKNLQNTLKDLQKLGCFEVTEIDQDKKKIGFNSLENQTTNSDVHLAEIDFAISMLTPFEDKKKSFKEKIISPSLFAQESDIENINKDFDFSTLVKRCAVIEEELNHKKNLLIKINEEKKVLSNWKKLNFSLSSKKETKNTVMHIGEIAAKDIDDFVEKLSKTDLVHFQIVDQNIQHAFFIIVFHKKIIEKIKTILDNFRFNKVSFSESNKTPKEEIEILEKSEKKLQKEIIALKDELKLLAKDLDKLKLTYDFFLWEKERYLAQEKVNSSAATILIEGWIPQKEKVTLEKTLQKSNKSFFVSSTKRIKNEKAPVKIKNNSTFSPFETVTKIFGLPQEHEIDPTPFLAPFFAVFFGFCLTDAGYGIFLALATTLILKFIPLDKEIRKMIRLLFMCGISTIFMGILFGGWFGLTPDQFPEFLTKTIEGKKMFKGQIFDPMTDLTSKIMPLAFSMGFLHLLFGIILSGVIKVKNGQINEAIQKSFFLAFCIAFAAFLLILRQVNVSENIFLWLQNIFLFLLLVLTWTMGCGTKNPILRILSGAMGIIDEMMSWLSNILSYSRLFALGLATGIIATIFNSLAVIFGGMLPMGINILVGLIIILFGHTINIGLNLLGAFIHSGRLQFVEFFGKFVECGARNFDPLKRKGKFLFLGE